MDMLNSLSLCLCSLRVIRGLVQDEESGDQQVYDPMRATVQPVFRSTPREGTAGEEAQGHGRLLFVSESNVCRSVLAEAFLLRMTGAAGLAEKVSIESKVSTCPLSIMGHVLSMA